MTRFSWHGCIADVDERAAGPGMQRSPTGTAPAALARARKLPAALLDMLDALPILPEKAAWACELYHGEDWAEKRLLCEFSWRIAGKIAGRPEGESGDSGRGPLVKFSWGGLCRDMRPFRWNRHFPRLILT